MDRHGCDRKTTQRLEGVRHSAASMAFVTAFVVIGLVAFGASLGLVLVAWAAFVADLLVLCLTSRRLAHVQGRAPVEDRSGLDAASLLEIG